jgi:hypothetical protein
MAQLSPERRAKVEARADELHREYLLLQRLREKLNLTQEELEKKLTPKQPGTLNIDHKDSPLTLEALSEVISALGGEWELTVKLPETDVMRLTGSEDFSILTVAS